MADAAEAELAAARSLSLADRVAHKNWKVRAEAYGAIADKLGSVFSSDDPIVSEAASLLSKAPGDANAAAADRGLDALVVWLGVSSDSQAESLAESACAALASKAFKGRPGTVQRAREAFLGFCRAGCGEAARRALLSAAGDRTPKVAVAALQTLRACVDAYGRAAMDPKAVLQALPGPLGAANAQVRDSAKEVALAFAAQLGPAVLAALPADKVPPAAKKDIDAAAAALGDERRAPELLTRSAEREKALREAQGGPGCDGGAGSPFPAEDASSAAADAAAAFDFAAPFDALAAFRAARVEDGEEATSPAPAALASSRWQARRAAWEALSKACEGHPRLLDTCDYGDISREARRAIQKDPNVTVVAAAAAASGALAAGLRRAYGPEAVQTLPVIFERFKERNAVAFKAIAAAARALALAAVPLPALVEAAKPALAAKAPKVRAETARVLEEAAKGASREDVKAALAPRLGLVAAVAPLLADADPGARDAAGALLGALAAKAGGMGVLGAAGEALDDAKKKKIEAVARQLLGTAKGMGAGAGGEASGAIAAARPGAGAPSSRPAAPSGAAAAGGLSARGPAAAGSGAGAASARSAAAASSASARSAAAAPPSSSLPPSRSSVSSSAPAAPRSLPSPEEARACVASWSSETVAAGLASSKWQERLAAVEELSAAASGPAPPGEDRGSLAAAVAVLPSVNDKNFQVVNKVLELWGSLAGDGGRAAGLGPAEAALVGDQAAERGGELKHAKPVKECLLRVSEAGGPASTLAALRRRSDAAKSPKVPAEALAWAAEAIRAFGARAVGAQACLDWSRAALDSPAAPVRARALELAGALCEQLGPEPVQAAVGRGLKPALLSSLDDAVKKWPKDPSYSPTRTVQPDPAEAAGGGRGRGERAGGGGGGGGGGGPGPGNGASGVPAGAAPPAASSVDDLDALLPRQDLRPHLTASVLAQLSSSNWKERAAGVEAVAGALEACGNRVSPDLGPNVVPALRARVGDANRNLAARAIGVVAQLASAAGPAWDRAARQALLAPLLASLSDGKRNVREAALEALVVWREVAGAARVVPQAAEVAGNPKTSTDGRHAAVAWIEAAVRADLEAARAGNARDALPAPETVRAALAAAGAAAADRAPTVREAGVALAAALADAPRLDDELAALADDQRAAAAAALAKAGVALGAGGGGAEGDAHRPGGGGAEGDVHRAAGALGASAPTRAPFPPSSGPNGVGNGHGPAADPPAALRSARSQGSSSPGRQGAPASGRAAASAATVLELLEEPLSTLEERARRRFSRPPGPFDALPPGEAEAVARELATVATPALAAAASKASSGGGATAGRALLAAARAQPGAAAACRDVLFRWVSLRLVETSPQATAAALELAAELCERAYDDQMAVDDDESSEAPPAPLCDAETSALLPALVERSGAATTDKLRALFRRALRAALAVSAPETVVAELAFGLCSRSSKTRVEAADALAAAAAADPRVGPAALSSRARPLEKLAALVGSRDAAARRGGFAAFEALAASPLGGRAVLNGVGRAGDKARDAVEERLAKVGLLDAGGDQQAADDGYDAEQHNHAGQQQQQQYHQQQQQQQQQQYHQQQQQQQQQQYHQQQQQQQAYGAGAGAPLSARSAGTPGRRGAVGGAGRGAPAGGVGVGVPPRGGAPRGPSAAHSQQPPPQPYSSRSQRISTADEYGEGHAADAYPGAGEGHAADAYPGAGEGYGGASLPAEGSYGYAEDEDWDDGSATTPAEVGPYLERWDALLAEIRSGGLAEATEALKLACAETSAAGEAPGRSGRVRREALGEIAEELFDGALSRLDGALRGVSDGSEPDLDPAAASSAMHLRASARAVKYSLNALLQGLAVPEAVRALPERSVRDVLCALLTRLLDSSAMSRFDEGQTLVKAVNVLTLRVLECADRSKSYAALLRLLRGPPASLPPRAAPKYDDLVVKCLVKLTKSLAARGIDGEEPEGPAALPGAPPAITEPLNVPLVLARLHEFFVFLGVDEIRRRSASDDKPLRMAKTVLHELCKLRGEDILEDARAVAPAAPHAPRPLLLAYVELNLRTLREAGALPEPSRRRAEDAGERNGLSKHASDGGAGHDGFERHPSDGGSHNGYDRRPSDGGSHTGYDRRPSDGGSHNGYDRRPSDGGSCTGYDRHPSDGGSCTGYDRRPSDDDLVSAGSHQASRAEVKVRLKDIMSRLMQRDGLKEALRDLRDLRRANPAVVDGYVESTSDMFQTFIRNGFADLDREEREARLASTRVI